MNHIPHPDGGPQCIEFCMKLVQAGTHTPEQAIEAWRRSPERLGLLLDRSAHYKGKRLSVSLGEAIQAKCTAPSLGSTFGESLTEAPQAKRTR